MEEAKARARQIGELKQGDEKPVKENFLNGGGQVRDRVAAYVGVSGRTLEKAEAVVEAAEREPETYGSVLELMDTTGKVDRPHRLVCPMEPSTKAVP